MRNRTHSGQILLITLLVLSIATTIALSLVARSTTDLTISNQVEESSRAFSAAEAGIEQALKLQSAPSGMTLANGASFSVTKDTIGGSVGAFAFPRVTTAGQVETVWLVNHDETTGLPTIGSPIYSNSTIDICFSSANSPALEVTVYYRESTDNTIKVARAIYDSISGRTGAQSESNNFSVVASASGGCGDGTNTDRKQTITFSDLGITPSTDTLIMLRLRPLYQATQIAVSTSVVLPLQGSKYDSCGTTGNGVSRCISVLQNYRTASGIYDNVIVSQNGSFSPIE